MTHRYPVAAPVVRVVLLSALAPLLLGAAKPGHESPQAVFDKFVKSAAADRWAEVYGCYDEPSGIRLLASVALNADAWVRTRSNDRATADGWAALVRKHSLTLDRRQLDEAADGGDGDSNGDADADDLTAEEQQARERARARRRLARVVSSVPDRGACFAALMTFMARATGRRNEPFKGQLEDIQEDGDRATATLVQEHNGQQIRRPFHFRRVDESWYLALPE